MTPTTQQRDPDDHDWDGVDLDAVTAPLPASQREELEHRLADSIARPGAGTPWEVVRDRSLSRARW